jgi:alcohol dehydrogenase YqhD (iron-dependent ADH family)
MNKEDTIDIIINKLINEWENDNQADLREYFCKVWNLAREIENEKTN